MDEQGITPVMPPRPGRPERKPPRGQLARRRAAAAVLLVGFLAVALYFALGLRADDAEVEATTPTVTTAPKPVILKILFPEGFTRKEMVQRVADVRQIAKTKRKVTPKLSGNAYAVASKAAKVPAPFRKHARGNRGLSLPGDLRVHAEDDRRSSSSTTRSSTSTTTGRRSTSGTRKRSS